MISIAIDGPAGAGKSTIAKKLSKDLGYIYVDTGAMYRAIALYLIKNNIQADNDSEISNALDTIEVTIGYKDGAQRIYLNNEDVTAFLRTEEVGNMASKSSANPKVRAKLTELQRQLARKENVVMDGRDIGTVVLPDAQVKIYLTASSKVRAKRRFDELTAKNEECDLDKIEQDIIQRDHQDMTREIAPLKQAEDAVLLDSSEMTIDEVINEMKHIIQEKI